jgi:hydroxymethylbilane synthase
LQQLVIATRESALALWQAYHIKDRINELFDDIEVVINKMTSNGDKVLDKPLALIGGKGHFTKELEDAMLDGKADIAVHSLKDVPTYIPNGLELAAITARQDQSDVFLSHKYTTLQELPKGAVVGTTSLRRRMQLLSRRPDLQVKDLRGNVNTRLRKLKEGQYDAIILAYIGLDRLDLLKDIPYTQKLDFIPPMGQAALGIEIVASNELAKEVAKALNDETTFMLTKIERDFVSTIEAGCSAPVAINAVMHDENSIKLEGMIGYSDGTNILHKSITIPIDEADIAGALFAQNFIDNGALDILKEAEKLAFKDEMPQRL